MLRDPVIRPLFGLFFFVGLFRYPFQQLLPAIAQQSLGVGAVELSRLLAAAGAGAFVGSLVTASLGTLRRKGIAVTVMGAASGLFLLLFGLQHQLLPALAFGALTAFSISVYVGLHITIYQQRAPSEMQGRVVAAAAAFLTALIPIGQLLIGLVGVVAGVSTGLALTGSVLLAAALWILWRGGSLRALGSIPAPAAASAAAGEVSSR